MYYIVNFCMLILSECPVIKLNEYNLKEEMPLIMQWYNSWIKYMTLYLFLQTSTNFSLYCFINFVVKIKQKLSEAAISLPVVDNKILYSKWSFVLHISCSS